MESKWIAGVLILAGLSAPAASAQESAAPSDGQLIYLEEVQATESAPAPKPKAPAGGPYKGVFYDNDFSYLDKPGAVKDDYYELLKRLRVAPGLVVDVGGEYRHQFKNEDRRSLFVGAPTNPRTDTYDLSRFRLYTDVRYNGWLRGYVEFIDAYSAHENLPPIAIDEDRTDLLNAFGEVLLFSKEGLGADVSLRVGRQELLNGQQRLISPLDWGNTRRTFEGAKLLSKSECWDHELFWTRPVIVDDVQFNQADQSQWFGGVYSTYKGFKSFTVSPYFLVLREEDGFGVGPNAPRGNTVFSNTLGDDSRVFTAGLNVGGGVDNWLWDVEGAYQFGAYGGRDISAGMMTAGLARKMPKLPWKPTLWLWYDWASGDNDPFDGESNTFNQLFPLAHKWFGYLDLVARQNIHDVSAQFILNPSDKLALTVWGHLFWLDEARDGLYNAAGVISRQDVTGNSGDEVGQEIDVTAAYTIRPGVLFEVGYCYFWSGSFIRNTGDGSDAHLLYTDLRIKY